MNVLLPGRYDPIHLGHWLLIYDALNQFRQVIIGIRDTQNDLFPTDDRYRIAVKALDGIERCAVVKIADIDQCQQWREVATFDAVISGNEQVRQAAGRHYEVIDTPRHGHYSATEIRRRLEFGLDIGDLIIPGTAALIWRFYQRIRSGHPA